MKFDCSSQQLQVLSHEKQQSNSKRTRHGQTWKTCSEKKTSRRKWLATFYHHQVDKSALHGISTMLKHNWDRDINGFATITQFAVAVNTSQSS